MKGGAEHRGGGGMWGWDSAPMSASRPAGSVPAP